MSINTTIVLGILMWTGPDPAAASDFAINMDAIGEMGVRYKNRTLLRIMVLNDLTTTERAHETYKVYAHVIDPLDPDGKRFITKGAGGQFTHHRGIFIGWNKLKVGDVSTDMWHMKDEARQIVRKKAGFLDADVTNEFATLTLPIDWVFKNETLIEEKRTFVVHAPDANGAFTVDVNSTLTAVGGDASFNGDPEHAGVQFRPSDAVSDNKSAKYLIPGGADVTKATDLPWTALTFQIDDRHYNVQHMTHPDTPTGTRYSAYRDYGRFGNFPVFDLPKGESITLKVRLHISPGEFPEDAESVMSERYSAYISEK